MRTTALLLLTTLLAGVLRAETVVTGVGRAPGEERTAREQALGDALRDAVRKGAGLDLVSATKVGEYALEYDRVFATAFGYVRDYKVLSSGLDEVGDYVVTIRATVGKGAPDVEDRLLVRRIIRLKGAPRLAIRGEETLNGVAVSAPAGTSVLAARAVDLGFRVISGDIGAEAQVRRAAREDLLGDGRTAALRRAGASAAADMLIRVRTAAEVGAPEAVYGGRLRPASLNLDLMACRTDSAEILVRRSPPAVKLTSSGASPEAALADALKRHLAEGAADAFLRGLLVRWVTELDLGTLIRIEIRGVGRERWRAVSASLRDSPGVTSVWERDFDARHLSLLDVESRMTAERLADRVGALLGTAFRADKVTSAYLAFIRDAVGSAAQPAPPPVPVDGREAAASPGRTGPPTETRMPPWILAGLALSGLVLAGLGGAFLARR